MANTNFNVNVNVNFNNVSYNATTQQFVGTPTWNVNPNLQGVPPVKLGTNTSTITWKLNAAAVPQGFNVTFPTSGTITFNPTPVWTGGAPTNQDSTTCVATDNFNGLASAVIFEYTIGVIIAGTSNGQNVSKVFTYDPDVENESGTVNVAALVRTRK